jgi:subtilisin family serine protease
VSADNYDLGSEMKKIIVLLLFAFWSIPISASASSFKSYYSYMSAWQPAQQISFATRMVEIYQHSNKTYASFIVRFSRYSSHAWYQSMQKRYAFQLQEIERYNAVIKSVNQKIILIDTIVTEVPGSVVQRRATAEASRSTSIIEERTEATVKEFAVTTVVYNTQIRTINYVSTRTTKMYNDGTSGTDTKTKVTSVEDTVETSTKVGREFIREYSIVVAEPTSSAFVKMEILTEEQYLERDDVSLFGTQTYMDAVTKMNSRINSTYAKEVLSRHFGNTLEAVGAQAAWARGFTGDGSIIAILDTGIDLDHSEFVGRIAGAKCFSEMCTDERLIARGTNETIQDNNRVSHGTHVAGIAAAAFDGKGTTGIAPDAELLIAKTAFDNGFYSFSQTDEAIHWAVENGADVINISANYNVDTIYKNSLEPIGDGLYFSSDTRGSYSSTGYSQLYKSETHYLNIVESMKGHEAVLVLAAGNQGLPIAGMPGNIAIDSEVGDRILLVGNYDMRNNDLHRSSNAAGTICLEKATDGACANTSLVSDRYLMAPGMYVASADNDGEYRLNSGSSMAAPMVSGAIAVVREMWPHMTGVNLSKLLLNTASIEEIEDYDVYRHGQGLLDLNEATKMQGAIGLPTTGRADGNIAEITNQNVIALSGGSISAFEKVMLIDDYDRDFYVDANSIVQVNDTRTASSILAAQQGVTPDHYIGFTGGTIIPMDNIALSINKQSKGTTFTYAMDNFTVGLQNEKGSYLGNIANSHLMRVKGAATAYAGYSFENGDLFGNAQFGATALDVDGDSYLKSAETLMSYSATIGAKNTIGKHTFGSTISLPVTIASGNAYFDMPGSVSSNGDIISSNVRSSLASQRQEINYGIFLNSELSSNFTIQSFAELRTNYAGTNNNTVEAGFNLNLLF